MGAGGRAERSFRSSGGGTKDGSFPNRRSPRCRAGCRFRRSRFLMTNAQSSAETNRSLPPRSALQAPLDLFENLLTPPTRITHHARRLAAVAAFGEQHVEHRDRAPQGVAQRALVGVGQLLVFGHRPILSPKLVPRIWLIAADEESNIRPQMGNRPRTAIPRSSASPKNSS